LDDTIVVITSDKGVHLGEHGLLGARYGLYDTAVHVPLVIWYPSQLSPGRVQTTVSTRAVYPTLVDLAGVEPCPGDLLPSLLDTEATPPVVVSELLSPKSGHWKRLQRRHHSIDLTPWERTYRSIEADGYKLIRSSLGELQLFHPASDPAESLNLVTQEPARLAAMVQMLDEWIKEEGIALVPEGAEE
jgi:arylsulfatase A-like enzyme